MHRRRQLVAADTVNRQWYVDEAEQCQWVEKVEIWRTGKLDPARLWGFVVKHGPGFIHGMVHDYTIVVAKGLSIEQERIVCIKELMHCFFPDGDASATNSELLLESHIRQLFGWSTTVHSAHVVAERTALWMALGVITPERTRRDLGAQVKAGNLDFAAVGERLVIDGAAAKLMVSDQADIEFPKLIN